MSLDFSSITGSVNFLLAGAAYTFELTAITAVLGLALGLLLHLHACQPLSGSHISPNSTLT